MKVTIGEMIDKLSVVNIKIFTLENLKRDKSANDSLLADATRRTNDLNVQRNVLIGEIDMAINEIAKGEQQQLFSPNKMYGK